jgi:hypothetical protein
LDGIFRVDTKQQSAQPKAELHFFFWFGFVMFAATNHADRIVSFFFKYCSGGSGEVTVTNNSAIIARQTKWPTEKKTHTRTHTHIFWMCTYKVCSYLGSVLIISCYPTCLFLFII